MASRKVLSRIGREPHCDMSSLRLPRSSRDSGVGQTVARVSPSRPRADHVDMNASHGRDDDDDSHSRPQKRFKSGTDILATITNIGPRVAVALTNCLARFLEAANGRETACFPLQCLIPAQVANDCVRASSFSFEALLLQARVALPSPGEIPWFCTPSGRLVLPIPDAGAFSTLLLTMDVHGVPWNESGDRLVGILNFRFASRDVYQVAAVAPGDLVALPRPMSPRLPSSGRGDHGTSPATHKSEPDDAQPHDVDITAAESGDDISDDEAAADATSNISQSQELINVSSDEDDEVVDLTDMDDQAADDEDADEAASEAGSAVRDGDGEVGASDGPDLMEMFDGAIEDDYIDKVVALFGCSKDSLERDGGFRPQPLKRSLFAYQLTAIIRLLDARCAGYPGTMLADEMGLGKTTTALALCWVTSTLLRLRKEVKAWRRDRSETAHAHLPVDAQCARGDAVDCPSGTYRLGVQCVCVKGSLSARYVKCLSEGPTLIFAADSILRQWLREGSDLFGEQVQIRFYRPSSLDHAGRLEMSSRVSATITSAHKQRRATSRKGKAAEAAQISKARSVGTQGWDVQMVPRVGQSAMIVLLAPSISFINILNSIKAAYKDGTSSRGATRHFSAVVAPGMIIQDEAHSVKGRNTLLHTFIRDLPSRLDDQLCQNVPWMLGMSGTPISLNIMDLVNVYDYNQEHGSSNLVEKVELRQIDRLFKAVTRLRAGKTAATLPQERERLLRLKDDHIQPWLVRRTQQTTLFGNRIVDFSAPLATEVPVEVPENCKRSMDAIAAAAQRSIEEILKRMQRDWDESPSSQARKPRPTMQEAFNKWRNDDTNFFLMRFCTTVPMAHRIVDRSPLLSESINRIVSPANDGVGAVQRLRDSDLATILEPFLSECPKVAHLVTIYKSMLADKEPDPKTTLVLSKKMVVLASVPASAAALALEFARRRPDAVVALVLAGLNNKARAATVAHFAHYPTEPSDEQGSPTVLFAAKSILGTGVHLARANYCVLADVALTSSDDTQSLARVHRLGQRLTTHLYRLVVPSSMVEQGIRNRWDKRAAATAFLTGAGSDASGIGTI